MNLLYLISFGNIRRNVLYFKAGFSPVGMFPNLGWVSFSLLHDSTGRIAFWCRRI